MLKLTVSLFQLKSFIRDTQVLNSLVIHYGLFMEIHFGLSKSKVASQ